MCEFVCTTGDERAIINNEKSFDGRYILAVPLQTHKLRPSTSSSCLQPKSNFEKMGENEILVACRCSCLYDCTTASHYQSILGGGSDVMDIGYWW